jgi:hypothetical protein
MLMNVFDLEIPFNKGYYEIQSLEQKQDDNFSFCIPDIYKWKNIPFKKRRLKDKSFL